MSKGTLPIVTCDNEDGCESWAIDYYEMGASVPKLPDGWAMVEGSDFYVLCPACIEQARPDKDVPTGR